jgi:hypothetical protein
MNVQKFQPELAQRVIDGRISLLEAERQATVAMREWKEREVARKRQAAQGQRGRGRRRIGNSGVWYRGSLTAQVAGIPREGPSSEHALGQAEECFSASLEESARKSVKVYRVWEGAGIEYPLCWNQIFASRIFGLRKLDRASCDNIAKKPPIQSRGDRALALPLDH